MPNDPSARPPIDEATRLLIHDTVGLAVRFTDAVGHVMPEALASLGGRQGRTSQHTVPTAPRQGGPHSSGHSHTTVDLRRDHGSTASDPSDNPIARLIDLGVEAVSTIAELPAIAFGSFQPQERTWTDETGSVPVLHLHGPPGTTAKASVVVDSRNSTVTNELDLHATDFTGPPTPIASGAVSFGPPRRFEGVDGPVIDVSVIIPDNALVGTYGGLVQSGSWPSVRIVLQLRVG